MSVRTAVPRGRIAVYGAYGHTARFVVAELCRRGWTPILCGRDAARLAALAAGFPRLETRVASTGDPGALDRALGGAIAVVNCAGSFLDTATPLLEAALRARIHYLDLAAEQRAALATFARDADARAAGTTAVPAMAFYGGLADLLATAALGDWRQADAIDIAVALDSWHPTTGTRRTGERNHGPRLVVAGGQLRDLADPPPTRDWTFPAPFGAQAAVGLPLSEIVVVARHVRCAEVHSWMNLAPLQDLRDSSTPPPVPADASGRSAQRFAMDVHVRRGDDLRRATARGRDIYATSAPLVVEALERILDGRASRAGVLAAGEAFDARGFLAAVSRDDEDFRVVFEP
ncbi:MAG TPA: saccharopine dehydrogenase NADP-binding domain-containing protein [Luteimonas sp.]|nr:saccharopine dehydrogenase NADP-binding domain-containing protein [Luteimonas sp.]